MSERMHIAYFTNTYRPTMSGVVRSIDTFRDALASLGNNVFIFAQHAADYEDTIPFVFRYPAIESPFANRYAFPIPASPCLTSIMPALKLDVIHSHHPVLLGETAASRAEELNLPLVFTFHTRYDEYSHYIPFEQKITKKLIVDWIGRYLNKCQHIITPSDSIRDLLYDAGVTGPITTVPTGIDAEPYRNADGQPIREKHGWGPDDIVLISVGRLAKEKSFDVLIDAAAKVMRDRPNVKLVIIGGGSEQKELEKQASALGIGDRVLFTGIVPYEAVPGYLKAANIFCFASTSETQGLVTMEAMAADLPVVAVDATGTRDIVEDGKDGLLTENSAAALAAGIERVVDNTDLRQTFVDNARAKIEWYDSKRQAQRMLDVYAHAKEEKRLGRSIKVERKPLLDLLTSLISGDDADDEEAVAATS